MIIVADANRIFSALIRDGETRRALFTTTRTVCAPAFLREEIREHEPRLARAAKMSLADFRKLVSTILDQVVWVDDDIVAEGMDKARKALAEVDPDDVVYLACAIPISADAIWSFDLDFDEQQLVRRIPHPDADIE